MEKPRRSRPEPLRLLGGFIFWTRWLQAPLYLGLIVAQAVYLAKDFPRTKNGKILRRDISPAIATSRSTG